MAGWRKARLSYVSLLKAELPARVPEEAPVTPHLGRNGPCGRGAVLPASRNRSRDRLRLGSAIRWRNPTAAGHADVFAQVCGCAVRVGHGQGTRRPDCRLRRSRGCRSTGGRHVGEPSRRRRAGQCVTAALKAHQPTAMTVPSRPPRRPAPAHLRPAQSITPSAHTGTLGHQVVPGTAGNAGEPKTGQLHDTVT